MRFVRCNALSRSLTGSQHSQKCCQVPSERLLMIGDTTHDLQMARSAGCASVGVSYGAHEPAAFDVLNPLHVAHSVRELHDWLLSHA